MLKKYIRNKRNEKIGCLVALASGKFWTLGYSKCNTSKDRFDNFFATEMAIGRAEASFEGRNIFMGDGEFKFPITIVDQIDSFAKYAKKVFKESEWLDEQIWNEAKSTLLETGVHRAIDHQSGNL